MSSPDRNFDKRHKRFASQPITRHTGTGLQKTSSVDHTIVSPVEMNCAESHPSGSTDNQPHANARLFYKAMTPSSTGGLA
jgi:hypothetical protein